MKGRPRLYDFQLSFLVDGDIRQVLHDMLEERREVHPDYPLADLLRELMSLGIQAYQRRQSPAVIADRLAEKERHKIRRLAAACAGASEKMFDKQKAALASALGGAA